jgi:hypothetical protein
MQGESAYGVATASLLHAIETALQQSFKAGESHVSGRQKTVSDRSKPCPRPILEDGPSPPRIKSAKTGGPQGNPARPRPR